MRVPPSGCVPIRRLRLAAGHPLVSGQVVAAAGVVVAVDAAGCLRRLSSLSLSSSLLTAAYEPPTRRNSGLRRRPLACRRLAPPVSEDRRRRSPLIESDYMSLVQLLAPDAGAVDVDLRPPFRRRPCRWNTAEMLVAAVAGG
jgi:hypothetical protein